ncbi:class Ib ribonucleoside-diphosphate reductase assembly flavoprotein NrdI [Sodalis sp. RH21]|uniref:class Ib ribonucleoside-diphosphate reductase assembly flavoprotein NrdI n=1 Tax=unclassified Sodalis (in: enterobacteria) TaxID=2636512 RepID=UPI0039B4915F
MADGKPLLVYFSSSSENTHRFVGKLTLPALRIPLAPSESLRVDRPYILIVPSYGGGSDRGAVPRQAIRFLNDATNRSWLRGVIGAGNRNFGTAFCLAGDIIAKKCRVPYLYRFELLGTAEDVAQVRKGVTEFWQQPWQQQS